MAVDPRTAAILQGLHEAGVDFIVVGGMAAVLLAVPILTEDADIVHRGRRTTSR